MNKKKIYNLTLFSVFSSIILMLTLIPNIGYITFIPGIASLQIIHIVVLVGVMFLPLNYSIGLGFVFGLSSLIASFMYAESIFDLAFQNPYISVLPRILFGLAAYYVYHGLKTLFEKLENGQLYSFLLITVVTILFLFFVSNGLQNVTGWNITYIYIFSLVLLIVLLTLYYYFLNKEEYKNLSYIPSVFIISTLLHSVFVLTMVAIVDVAAYEGADIVGVIMLVLSTNSLFEALIAVLIGSPLVVALYSIKEKGDFNDFDV